MVGVVDGRRAVSPRTLPDAKTALDLFAWLDTELKAGRLTAAQYDILWAYVLAHR